jgi:hypothetical protein
VARKRGAAGGFEVLRLLGLPGLPVEAAMASVGDTARPSGVELSEPNAIDTCAERALACAIGDDEVDEERALAIKVEWTWGACEQQLTQQSPTQYYDHRLPIGPATFSSLAWQATLSKPLAQAFLAFLAAAVFVFYSNRTARDVQDGCPGLDGQRNLWIGTGHTVNKPSHDAVISCILFKEVWLGCAFQHFRCLFLKRNQLTLFLKRNLLYVTHLLVTVRLIIVVFVFVFVVFFFIFFFAVVVAACSSSPVPFFFFFAVGVAACSSSPVPFDQATSPWLCWWCCRYAWAASWGMPKVPRWLRRQGGVLHLAW